MPEPAEKILSKRGEPKFSPRWVCNTVNLS